MAPEASLIKVQMAMQIKVDSCNISILKSFFSCKKKRTNKQKGEPGASCYNFSWKHTKTLLNITGRGQKDTGAYDEQIAGHVVTLWELAAYYRRFS